MYTVLICDDDEDIRHALEIYLTGGGYRVLSAANGWEALKLMEGETVHLILLDIMMPVLDGTEVLALLREKKNNVPVIFLTAKGEDDDKIAGLELGADDYITKPFNAREVLARVKALLRRYSDLGGIGAADSSVLSLGGIELDDDSKTVTCDGEPVPVTPKEYDIPKFFMHHPGKVFSSREIYRSVWQDTPMGTENTVAVHIRHLREKLEIDPADPRHLKDVWGKGYKIE